ncbi:sensor histidine kinase [Streptomyces sp. URMC 123]|uniref:sensor histidine kinase n=1 Tax=Streptomyces sp. URMC 123 TaxID=3423403 RepID=UPI003F1C5F74
MRNHPPVDAAEDVPGTAAPDPTATARVGWYALWDGYFAISYLVTTALLFASGGGRGHRAVAIGALTLAIPWYAAIGRSRMRAGAAGRAAGGRNAVFAAGLLLLFGTAVAAAPVAAFAGFTVVPMLLMALPTRTAVALAVPTNLLPTAAVWLHGGRLVPDVLTVLPLSLLGLALSVFLGLWIGRVVRQSAERAALIEELRRHRERGARLSREAGVAAERERLAREIHDTLAQGLTSIISLVQAAGAEVRTAPERALTHLGLAERVATESLAEARDFVAALTPPPLRESSLAQAVRRQADGLVAQTGVEARCAVEGTERPLPMATTVVLLRAAQEAIANVRKHAASAHRVEVALTFGDSAVRLAVQDDGAGFAAPGGEGSDARAPGGADGGYGLRGMRARVAEIGGTVTVRSRPGAGTRVEVTVPAPIGGRVTEETVDVY